MGLFKKLIIVDVQSYVSFRGIAKFYIYIYIYINTYYNNKKKKKTKKTKKKA